MFWLWLVAAILLFIFIIFISKLKVFIKFNHAKGNSHYQMKFTLWFGLIRYTYKIPVEKVEQNPPKVTLEEEKLKGKSSKEQTEWRDYTVKDIFNTIENAREFLEHVIGMHRIVRRFFKTVSIEKIQWETIIGVGDAASTGVISGMAWSLKGSVLGLISSYMKLKDGPLLKIVPYFQVAVSETKFQCMISFRIGNAILTGLRILKHWKKIDKKQSGKFKKEKVEQTSQSAKM